MWSPDPTDGRRLSLFKKRHFLEEKAFTISTVPTGSVLVVEDDPDMRALLTMALEVEGTQVIAAANGAEAYNLARIHKPSLIVLDLMMPVMSGEEFRRVQLADKAIRNIPVLVVSAHYEARKIAKRIKAVGCFGKPVEFDELVEFVKRRCR